jgi:restriction endonuclease S subunit
LSSPFDEQKYTGLLEGLEISEILLSEAVENKDYRIDSDFWTKMPKKNPQLKYMRIGDVLLSAQYGISVAMNEDNIGYPIYRMNEIHNMLCDLSVDKCADISLTDFEKFELKNRDVLFNRTNSFEWVGRTGIYYQNDEIKKTFASYLVRFNPNSTIVLPEYLATFLNTRQGVWDVKRRARQSINQTNVNPEEVKEIEIPILSMDFQKQIRTNFEKANRKRIQSESLYRQAEELLLETIGLKDFKPSQEGKNIKSFKESFLSTGRLDAEYYQPKYEDYLQLIKNYFNGYELLQTICHLEDDNYTPADNQEYKYIELSDVGKSGNITGCTTAQGIELPTRARRRVNKKDVIISSIEGSLESCALITKDYDKALCSTGFYVINSSKINSETLLVLFKSELMQNILKQNCSGTILTAINKTEFQNIPIPVIDYNIQQQIAGLMEESFAFRRESERLLDEAKGMVEREIEKGDIKTRI